MGVKDLVPTLLQLLQQVLELPDGAGWQHAHAVVEVCVDNRMEMCARTCICVQTCVYQSESLACNTNNLAMLDSPPQIPKPCSQLLRSMETNPRAAQTIATCSQLNTIVALFADGTPDATRFAAIKLIMALAKHKDPVVSQGIITSGVLAGLIDMLRLHQEQVVRGAPSAPQADPAGHLMTRYTRRAESLVRGGGAASDVVGKQDEEEGLVHQNRYDMVVMCQRVCLFCVHVVGKERHLLPTPTPNHTHTHKHTPLYNNPVVDLHSLHHDHRVSPSPHAHHPHRQAAHPPCTTCTSWRQLPKQRPRWRACQGTVFSMHTP